MTSVTVKHPADAELVATLHALDDATLTATGHEAMPEAVWRALADRPDDCVVAITGAGDAAAVSIPSDSFTPQYRQLALTTRSGAPGDGPAAALRAVLAEDRATRLTAWIPGSDPDLGAALIHAGFAETRRQHRMEVPLPLDPPGPPPDGIAVQPFRVGTDERAWLRVNNRAFANHPEQGGWIEAVLARRMAEPWFDAAGFLLAWRGDDLVGSCWTKVHPHAIGEIFVVGVDPDAQGIGLGRHLVVAGLDDLARRRGCTTGALYVAADNPAAIALYDSLGFRIARTDTAFTLDRGAA